MPHIWFAHAGKPIFQELIKTDVNDRLRSWNAELAVTSNTERIDRQPTAVKI